MRLDAGGRPSTKSPPGTSYSSPHAPRISESKQKASESIFLKPRKFHVFVFFFFSYRALVKMASSSSPATGNENCVSENDFSNIFQILRKLSLGHHIVRICPVNQLALPCTRISLAPVPRGALRSIRSRQVPEWLRTPTLAAQRFLQRAAGSGSGSEGASQRASQRFRHAWKHR